MIEKIIIGVVVILNVARLAYAVWCAVTYEETMTSDEIDYFYKP